MPNDQSQGRSDAQSPTSCAGEVLSGLRKAWLSIGQPEEGYWRLAQTAWDATLRGPEIFGVYLAASERSPSAGNMTADLTWHLLFINIQTGVYAAIAAIKAEEANEPDAWAEAATAKEYLGITKAVMALRGPLRECESKRKALLEQLKVSLEQLKVSLEQLNALQEQPRKAAAKRHAPDRAAKAQALAYFQEEQSTFKSIAAAARAIAGRKGVHRTEQTVRKWIDEHLKELRSARRQ